MEIKKTITTTCLLVLLLSTACLPNSFEDENQPSQADRVPLGIRTATAAITKALVTPGVQTTNGMKIGLFATGADYYVSDPGANDVASFTYSSANTAWEPSDPNIFLTAEIATLYGFYPFDAALTKSATEPTIAVSIRETAASFAATNNNASDGTVFNASADEIDYMAFVPANGKGRLVNNGKAGGTTTNDNLGSNPGHTLASLTLEHGMAMVSFRLYNEGTYNGDAEWTKFVLKNEGANTVLSKGTSPVMKLTDASIIPGASNAAIITREFTGYTVPKPNGTSIADADAAKAAAYKVSCLVLPITTTFDAGKMQVVLTIDGKDYTVNIPATVPADKWERGKNYLYSLKLSGTGLAITSVNVANWGEVSGGNIDVN